MNHILTFLHNSEGLKRLLRHSWLSDGRQESVAEHTWRVALMAVILHSRLKTKIDIEKVLKMIIIHDLAEIYAGDHHAWRGKLEGKYSNEKVALEKLLKTLPNDVKKELISLWEEFEGNNTNEAKFAQSLDKLEALIQHNEADIKTWEEKEYSFNLTYGKDKCSWNEAIKELRMGVDKETKEKIMSGK